jgi:Sulfotransferase family
MQNLELRNSPDLIAVLIRSTSGRTGTTLVMTLLLTSPEVVSEQKYPYEWRYLSGFLAHLDALEDSYSRSNEKPRDPIARRKARQAVPRSGLGFSPTLIDLDRFRKVLLSEYWHEFTSQIRIDNPGARLYPEKAGLAFIPDMTQIDSIPHCLIHLVRDPRDTWASILAFDERRGFYGFGRQHRQSRASYLEYFIDHVKTASSTFESEIGLNVRYEDLMADIGKESERIANWLGTTLSPDAMKQHERHRTAVDNSVGRWRDDLPAKEARQLTRDLKHCLERWGYE